MKKTLLIGAAILVCVAGIAQNSRQAANLNSKFIPSKGGIKMESEFPTSGTKRNAGPVVHYNPNAVCNPVRFTSGPNSFGVGGGVTTYKQTDLSYNKDLNSYVWTHRRSQEWVFSGKTSGAIQATWLNVTTGIWDSTIMYRDSTNGFRGRYPAGTFYNPVGNTNIANTWLVATGPCVIGGAFAGPFYATRKLTGTTADQTVLPANDVSYYTAPSGPLGNTLFPNFDLQQVGTKVLLTGDLIDTTTSANANHIGGMGTTIAKCDFSTGSPVWSHDSIVPGLYFKRNAGGNGYAISPYNGGEGCQLAFGPSGTVGYAVMIGRLSNTCNNSSDSALTPIVYKTTNGGTSWAHVLGGYDWRGAHPELAKNVGCLKAVKPHNFELNYRHGFDVTVDANDVLHLVGSMQDPYIDGASPDSLVFQYTYTHDYINYHPVMWDMMTDGTTGFGWKTMMIDSIVSSWVGGDPATDTTAAFGSVTSAACPATTYLPYGARLQVSRSTDGTKIIYSWADSDPTSTGTVYNSQPDIWMKGYDVTGNKATTSSNVTSGVATCFFHMMADIAYFDGGTSMWVAPVVYSLPRVQCSAGVYDGTSPNDHFYVKCGQYSAASFSVTPTINAGGAGAACLIGIKTVTNTFVNSVSNYPNPFNHSTNIVVNLNEGKSINVSVFDAIGNLVSVKNVNGNVGANTIVFDATNLNAGVYYYTVTAGFEKVTKKMVIQK